MNDFGLIIYKGKMKLNERDVNYVNFFLIKWMKYLVIVMLVKFDVIFFLDEFENLLLDFNVFFDDIY